MGRDESRPFICPFKILSLLDQLSCFLFQLFSFLYSSWMPSGNHLSLIHRKLIYFSHINHGKSPREIHDLIFFGLEDVVSYKYVSNRCSFFRTASWSEVCSYINERKSRHPNSVFKLGATEMVHIKCILDGKRNRKLKSLTSLFIDEFYDGDIYFLSFTDLNTLINFLLYFSNYISINQGQHQLEFRLCTNHCVERDCLAR